MTTLFEYNINDVRPYINWVYFYHAWGLSGKPASEKAALRSEAEAILAGLGDFITRMPFSVCSLPTVTEMTS